MNLYQVLVLTGVTGAGLLLARQSTTGQATPLAATAGPGQAAGTADRRPPGVQDLFDPLNCVPASSTPRLGTLYPLSENFNVNPNGNVGIGTVLPLVHKLTVLGSAHFSRAFTGGSVIIRQGGTGQNLGTVETWSNPQPFSQARTNTISATALDPRSGAHATLRNNQVLVAMTTSTPRLRTERKPALVSVAEVAGIDGETGEVFGAAKTFVQPHPTDPSKEIQFVSLEGSEHGVYARGTLQCTDGRAEIHLQESFRLVARSEGLTIHLTPLGPTRGLYVESKGPEAIVVRENEGGPGDASFDYLVMGVRAAMPDHVAVRENRHFVPEPGSPVTEGRLPGSYRELLIQNGTLNVDGSVNVGTAANLGWKELGGAWSGGRRASADVAD